MQKIICPECKGERGFTYKKITFWSNEEPQIEVMTFRQCVVCDGKGEVVNKGKSKED